MISFDVLNGYNRSEPQYFRSRGGRYLLHGTGFSYILPGLFGKFIEISLQTPFGKSDEIFHVEILKH
jgi:hypothetical protein